MKLNLCLIVDSNLKGTQLGSGIRPRDKPYIRCRGRVFCPYIVDPHCNLWPAMSHIKESSYTDIVIALGMNHCKKRSADKPWISAAHKLCETLLSYEKQIPGVRVYCVPVPPSLSAETTKNAEEFNAILRSKLCGTLVQIVSIPNTLYGSDGLLLPKFARPGEEFKADTSKLHLNNQGLQILTYSVCKSIRKFSGKRLR